jgi:tRNA(Ile)-lysidine synthase TilS/MesJ
MIKDDDDIQEYVRPWKGLTEKDLEQLCAEHHIIYGGYVLTFAKDIEAKLKEKNS